MKETFKKEVTLTTEQADDFACRICDEVCRYRLELEKGRIGRAALYKLVDELSAQNRAFAFDYLTGEEETVYSSEAAAQSLASFVADALGERAKTTSLGGTIKLKGKAEGFEILTLDELI